MHGLQSKFTDELEKYFNIWRDKDIESFRKFFDLLNQDMINTMWTVSKAKEYSDIRFYQGVVAAEEIILTVIAKVLGINKEFTL